MRLFAGNQLSWLRVIGNLLAITLVIVPACWAQIPGVNDQTATPTAGVGHDYIHMLNETVNPANGAVSLRINVPMPKGRGLTLPFAFVYNSGGLWAPASGLPNTNPSFGSNLNDSNNSTFYTENGWSYSLPLISMLGLDVGPVFNPPKQNCPVETNFVFQDTSGSTYSLGMTSVDYPYEQPGPLFPCGSGGNGSATGGTDFYSASVDSFQGNISIFDADGTKYSFPSSEYKGGGQGACFTSPGSLAVSTQIYPLSVEDRNGNMISFSVPQGCTGPFTETDTAGRPVLSSSGFGTSGNTVTVDGLSPYTITWGTTPSHTALGSTSRTQSSACGTVIANSPPESLSVITAITLPNGQKYQFSYDSITGLLSKITYPTGGYVSYTWAPPSTQSEFAVLSDTSGDPQVCPFTYDSYVVSQRSVSYDGSTVALQQNFSYSTTWNSSFTAWTQKNTTETTHDQIQGITYTTSYIYSPMNTPTFRYENSFDNVAPQVAMEQTVIYNDQNGHMARTTNKAWLDLYELGCELQTLDDDGLISGQFYQYGLEGTVTDKKEFDYGIITSASGCQPGAITPPSATATRETVTAYQGLGAILDRPCKIVVEGNVTAETDYLYDGGGTVCGTAGTPSTLSASTPSGTHDETNYGPTSSTPRGNATKITRRCLSGCSTDSSTTYTYDETGQVLSEVDPCGNTTCSDMTGTTHTTTYSYTDNYSSCGGSAPPSGNTNAYLTQIKNALGQIETYCYGYNDGQLRGATDPNNQPTIYKYVDSLARLTETDYPDTGRTLISYNDTPPTPSVTTSKEITPGQYVTSTSVMNGVGLVTETELTSDPAGTDYTATTYDGEGKPYTVSNPYHSTSDPTYGITIYTHDALGRTTQITHPDGSKISTSYTGRAAEVTDEGNGTKSVQRISQTDALGRLTSVCEVSGTTLLGTSPAPSACGQDIGATGFLTSYSYNALGNLTGVTQGGLNPRTFAYDSLSRLTSATNPESGQTSYSYDADSNLSTKTDARGVTTTYAYDALDRMTSKTYSDGTTPGSYFTYDASSEWGVTLTHPIGRLVLESADNGHAMAIFSYDPMGRTANEYQCTPLNCGSGAFPLAYTYDFLGDVQTSTNGEGVTLTQTFNAVAQLTTVTSSLSDASHPPTLLSNVAYNPLGALSSSTLGNGLNEALSYTNRAWLQSLTVTGTNLSDGNPATGSVTVGGSEKSTSGGTPGTGSVTISGTEQSTVINTCQSPTKASSISPNNVCLQTIYDAGPVSITVNGVAESVGYGKSSTDSSIASALALAFNNDSRSPVTATASGGTVSLTSKTTGTSSDYPLSATSSTNDPTDFGGPSFTPSTSGATLTGGTGGSPVYDSGTVSITVNGFPETVSYGNGSTTSSIAAGLASAFNSASGSPVTATSGGGVVTLSSKTIGSSTDYSLSGTSQTNNPGQFGSPSFTTSPSGQNLTGGTGGYSVSLSYASNGDVLGANDSANGNWTYAYDDFNRLASANTTGQAYTYAYDRFGNRWQQNGPHTMMLTFSGANNRMDGYSYDAAGNVLNDGVHSYTYDAENRIVTVDGGATTYVYDADGQRVRKTVGGASTDYVYDQAGHAIAEASASGWQRGEVYAGGRHLATYTNSTTYFDHGDWLGTERVRTAVNGSVCESITSLPFGDGMSTAGSCAGVSTRHFTGKERDPESNLDYFGARYYSSSLGRFATPDPLQPAMSNSIVLNQFLTDPQAWDEYAYSLGNPITYRDQGGHFTGNDHERIQMNAMLARGYDQNAIRVAATADVKMDNTINMLEGVEFFHHFLPTQGNPQHGERADHQTVAQAKAAATDFMNTKTRDAAAAALRGDVGGALADLGQASHTAQDIIRHKFETASQHPLHEAAASPEEIKAATQATENILDQFQSQVTQLGQQQGLSAQQISKILSGIKHGNAPAPEVYR